MSETFIDSLYKGAHVSACECACVHEEHSGLSIATSLAFPAELGKNTSNVLTIPYVRILSKNGVAFNQFTYRLDGKVCLLCL